MDRNYLNWQAEKYTVEQMIPYDGKGYMNKFMEALKILKPDYIIRRGTRAEFIYELHALFQQRRVAISLLQLLLLPQDLAAEDSPAVECGGRRWRKLVK